MDGLDTLDSKTPCTEVVSMAYEVTALLDELLVQSAVPDDVGAMAREQGVVLGPDDLPGDWRVEWEERAAIMEYDGCMPRERAEALALDDVLRRMRLREAKTRD